MQHTRMTSAQAASDLLDSSNRSPFSFLRPDLDRVESLIRRQATDFDPAVEPYMAYVLNTSGKRIRPVLVFLAGGATGGANQDHDKLAVVLELIHVATLVHDDIIDGAEIRRQAPSANAKWGNALAVLLGDSLFSHALMLSTEFDDLVMSRKIAGAAKDVCSGEITQTQRRFDLQLSRAEYFDIIEKKTAALFAVAMELAGRLNRQTQEVCDTLYQCGLDLGTAYQIYDDCVDLIGDESEFGKTLRTDLNKGKLTLPILNLRDSATESQREKLSRLLLQRGNVDIVALSKIADYVGAIEAALDTGVEHVERARMALGILPESEHKQALLNVASYLDLLLQSCRQ